MTSLTYDELIGLLSQLYETLRIQNEEKAAQYLVDQQEALEAEQEEQFNNFLEQARKTLNPSNKPIIDGEAFKRHVEELANQMYANWYQSLQQGSPGSSRQFLDSPGGGGQFPDSPGLKSSSSSNAGQSLAEKNKIKDDKLLDYFQKARLLHPNDDITALATATAWHDIWKKTQSGGSKTRKRNRNTKKLKNRNTRQKTKKYNKKSKRRYIKKTKTKKNKTRKN